MELQNLICIKFRFFFNNLQATGICFFVMLFSGFNLLGQEYRLGLNVKLSVTDLKDDDFESTNRRAAFGGGLTLSKEFESRIVLGSEIGFRQNGVRFNSNFTDFNGISIQNEILNKFNINYLTLPIQFGYAFGNGIKLVPSIGFRSAYLLSAKVIRPESIVNGRTVSESSVDISEGIKEFDFGYFLSLEVLQNYKSNLAFTIQLTYDESFSKFFEIDEESDGEFMRDSRHQYFAFSMGLVYVLKKQAE